MKSDLFFRLVSLSALLAASAQARVDLLTGDQTTTTSTNLLSDSWKFYTRLPGETGGHSSTIFIPADPAGDGTRRFIRTRLSPLP